MKEDYPGQHLWEIISSAGLGVSICEMSHSSSLFYGNKCNVSYIGVYGS